MDASGIHADLLFPPSHSFEMNGPFDQGEQRVITSDAHISTGMNACSPLPDDNTAGVHFLTGKEFDSQILRI